MKLKQHMIAATIILFIVASSVLFLIWPKTCLQLVAEDGSIYLEEPVKEGTVFSVTFIHSVNKSPVTDYYVIKDGDIYVTSTLYYDFGAGVQSELEEGQTLEYTEDGGMLISGFDRKIDPLSYVVGMVSDHVLEINGKTYSLREQCGKGTYVTFRVATAFDWLR
ncbi:MAG: DUF1850 domain-containing protein [Lachnospiraceae bacterium]|nr:DUF1850 domain-containing protein [Lachnospiraceae bacterium]